MNDMIRYIAVFLSAAWSCALGEPPPLLKPTIHDVANPSLVVDAEPRSVRVESLPKGTWGPNCSWGFFVDDQGTLLTVRHGTEDAVAMWVNLGEDGILQVKEVLADRRDLDVLVLRTVRHPTGISPFEFSQFTPARDDTCYVVTADPSGLPVRSAALFLEHHARREQGWVEIGRKFVPGESGSPLVDSSNKVIGMIVRGGPLRGSAVGSPL
jgi:hypothetical protein